MTDKEAMQMALETAEQIASADYRHWGELASLGEFERWARSRANHIAEALRARLAQPEQEPVAWMYKGEPWFDGTIWHDQSEVTTHKRVAMFKDKNAKPLYTAPPQREWVGLTDDEVDDIGCDFATLGGDIDAKDWFAFYLAIEAKLKEKNS